MSYSIDVYRGKLQATKNLLNFALFAAFFPQLVAGPIERASNMLPKFAGLRTIRVDQLQTGFFLILWGYFKKDFIADNAAVVANEIFSNYESYSGLAILIGVLAFAIQIFGDFSGYSNIARGISRLMGLELMVNYKLPYFAISPVISGGAGMFRFQRGCEIIYIYFWARIEEESLRRIENCS